MKCETCKTKYCEDCGVLIEEVVEGTNTIDCDADPYLPYRCEVEEHIKGGQLEWDPSRIELWLSQEQQDGGTIIGTELRKLLAGKLVLNANVLDYLLKKENQHLIPESWKGKTVFFWGTIYRDRLGALVVRCLYWNGAEWDWGCDWLGSHWNEHNPAAVSARN